MLHSKLARCLSYALDCNYKEEKEQKMSVVAAILTVVVVGLGFILIAPYIGMAIDGFRKLFRKN